MTKHARTNCCHLTQLVLDDEMFSNEKSLDLDLGKSLSE